MKVFVTDKYSVATALLIAAALCVALPFALRGEETASQSSRELPVYSVERSDKKLSVTFDCAWGADDVDAVISVLKEHDCRATFFVLGSWAEKYPEAVKKLHEAGHEIAGHSYDHTYYTQMSPEEMRADMDKCDAAIKKITGETPRLFRVPAGDYNNSVIETVRASGRLPIQWDADSLDYRGLSAAEMEERIMSRVQNGSIILFHTGTDNTAAALGPILERLAGEGYEFCPVGELVCFDNYYIDNTGRQFPSAPQSEQ